MQRVFFKCNALFVLLTLQIICQGQAELTQPSTFLTINFKNKYFQNSVDWSGLYLQVYIPLRLANILRFTVFRLLENAL